MKSMYIEIFLAKLYSNENFLKEFLLSPQNTIEKENLLLSSKQKEDLLKINHSELILATQSYKKKRNKKILPRILT